jgi:hypothetical protein
LQNGVAGNFDPCRLYQDFGGTLILPVIVTACAVFVLPDLGWRSSASRRRIGALKEVLAAKINGCRVETENVPKRDRTDKRHGTEQLSAHCGWAIPAVCSHVVTAEHDALCLFAYGHLRVALGHCPLVHNPDVCARACVFYGVSVRIDTTETNDAIVGVD